MARMTISRKALCAVYALIALLALIGTWGNNIAYLNLGFLQANARFWQDTLVNPASRSITVDIFFLFVAAAIWMLLEARKLSMRWPWLYLLFGALVAISVTFPLFLIHRERALARQDGSASAGQLTPWDVVGLVLCGIATCAYMVKALS